MERNMVGVLSGEEAVAFGKEYVDLEYSEGKSIAEDNLAYKVGGIVEDHLQLLA
jgi:hypothetical protein